MAPRFLFLFSALLATATAAFAQCKFATDEVDPFDSTRLVTTQPMPVGLLIPSLYETVDGPKIIEEAQVAFSFTESDQDSLEAFFLTIAAPEYSYLKIESGQNVIIAFSDSSAVPLLNFPDQGTFDKNTNMRIYQHTCLVPLDLFYRMSNFGIVGIRIRYKQKKRTIMLTPEQQEALMEAVRCAAEAVGLAPVSP
ncbi:hypothetical protein [Phaeodactylibacter luteus]|uniref:DUF4384 domain-containing protein n=1 Tax=Phaeodactylibacter luteus TaxID=1564516 RepID=A0A5C6RJN3_9BACT|nr:hypothetical protein [Phaeodactylibacter luteus]TXB61900.1 hypothetical protein FRY97_16760 [Phaeodactylibacter luteus]